MLPSHAEPHPHLMMTPSWLVASLLAASTWHLEPNCGCIATGHQQEVSPAVKETRNKELQEAVKLGDAVAVCAALDSGADPYARFDGSGILLVEVGLMHALDFSYESNAIEIKNKKDEKALAILECFFSHDFVPNRGQNLLLQSISSGSVRLTECLLAHGANPSWPLEGFPPLYWAHYYQEPGIAKMLVDKGATPMKEADVLQAKLTGASSYQGNPISVKRAIEAGAQVNVPDIRGNTALGEAASTANVAVLWYLLSRGANPNIEGRNGMYSSLPLCASAMFASTMSTDARFDCVSLLLEYGADVSAVDSRGRTALHYACQDGCVRIANLLMEANCKLMVKDAEGKTPLDLAKSGEVIAILKAAGATER